MFDPIRIDDPHDPRISAYRDIRERDLVGREGLFIAEGEVVLRTLLTAARGHAPVSVLLAESRAASQAGLLALLPPGVPVYLAEQGVLDGITGFHLHRGILALGRRARPIAAQALLSGCGARALVVVLIGLGNHDNVGGAFRNAAAFGADAVLLDAGCCDPLYRKAIRVSVGAALRVPFARLAPGSDPIALLASAGFEALALSPAGAIELADMRRPERVAALFGAEGPGLPAALLGRATTVRIAMSGGFDSLNVATAAGIVLHHLTRRGEGASDFGALEPGGAQWTNWRSSQ